MNKYWGKNPGTVPPHPFAISDVAYRQMLRDRKNQAGSYFAEKVGWIDAYHFSHKTRLSLYLKRACWIILFDSKTCHFSLFFSLWLWDRSWIGEVRLKLRQGGKLEVEHMSLMHNEPLNATQAQRVAAGSMYQLIIRYNNFILNHCIQEAASNLDTILDI